MAETKFDAYQTNAINARKNSVVSAGAGSGKTTVLAERFSSLVLDPKQKVGVDQILTLTFTKKATVEMSARIYKVLKKHAPEKAADFFKANIKTLDSYCNSVAKMGCHYYGISPDFTQDDDQIRGTVYAMALPYILEHRDNETIKALVSADNFDSIANQLFVEPILSASTVAEPIDFDRMLQKQVTVIVEKWNSIVHEINDAIVEMEKMFNNLGEVNKGSKAYIEFDSVFGPGSAVDIPEPLEITSLDIESCNVKKIEDYVLAIEKIASLKKPGNAKGLKEITPTLNELKDYFYSYLSQYFNFIYGYKMTLGILPLLKDFQDKVNAYKRSSGILSFKDISNMAKCILRDFPEIRQIEKDRYKFIMIDEFQDNNSDQRDMLFMLAEKKSRKEAGIPSVDELEKEKLFFVGDEKQSIYRFRGADVSVFNALSKDFTEGNLTMSTNYRSDSALIKGFNTIFGGYDYPLSAAPLKSEEETMPAEIPSAFFNEHSKYENDIPEYEAKYKEVLLPEAKE
ncbi:MAG: UvrD-helicase domain-containing protein, partial [Spirochaetales bacterium]|nr:UvrD-helicase domain-containing protein [Spirochaetales bacterium]